MEVLLPILLFAFGVLILLKGADLFVSGASSIAVLLKLNPIVIGLTVVAFGTSAPELIVSVTSAISGNTDIALGNIIGSNIANILLILGAAAIICPLTVQKNTIWKEIPMSFLGAVVLSILALQTMIDNRSLFNLDIKSIEIVGSLTTSNGLILLAFFAIFLYYTFGISKATTATEPEIKSKSLKSSLGLLLFGLVGLTFGSKLLVDNGSTLARLLGVSDTFIGLTLVAVGTSLPELITSLVAASKKQVDIAVGNVVGSNIFNIFFILGTTALVSPLPLRGQNVADILVLFASTLLLAGSLFVMKRHTIGRVEGSFMLVAYASYITFLVVRG